LSVGKIKFTESLCNKHF